MTHPPLDIPETAQIEILPAAGHYVSRRVDTAGQEQSVHLTPDDILRLYQDIPQYARLVMQAEQPGLEGVPDLGSEVWAAARRAMIVLDTHSTVVLFRIEDDSGLESRFALDPELARRTGQTLMKKADEVDAALTARIRQ